MSANLQERWNAWAHPATGHKEDVVAAALSAGWLGVWFRDTLWEALAFVPVFYVLNRLARRWWWKS